MKTIGQLSKQYGVSPRAIRYYEKEGILVSGRLPDSDYRVYDEAAELRLKEIVLLRKLRIPIRRIAEIFRNDDAEYLLSVFRQNLEEIDREIDNLKTIRKILASLSAGLDARVGFGISRRVLSDKNVMKIIETIPIESNKIQEVSEMNAITKLFRSVAIPEDVRVVHLNPYTVASINAYGETPEEDCGAAIEKLIKLLDLAKIMPEARVFGFNCPDPSDDSPCHGYESWVTVPPDAEIPPPFTKKSFAGGLYAAHAIKFGDFREWERLKAWAKSNDRYEADFSAEGAANMYGCLEEGIDYLYYSSRGWPSDREDQMDLLLPIKPRKRGVSRDE